MQQGILWIGSFLLLFGIVFSQVVGGNSLVEPLDDIEIVFPMHGSNFTELNVSLYVVSNISNIYGYLNGNIISVIPNITTILYSSYGNNELYICFDNDSGTLCENVNYTVFYPPFSFFVNNTVYSDRTSLEFRKINNSFSDVSMFVLSDNLFFYSINEGSNVLYLNEGVNDFTLFYTGIYEGNEYTFKQGFRVFSYASAFVPSNFYMYDVNSIFSFIQYELSKRTFLGVSTVFVIVSGLFMILLFVQIGDFSSKLMVSSFICAVVYMLLAGLFNIASSEFYVYIIFAIIGASLKFFGS